MSGLDFYPPAAGANELAKVLEGAADVPTAEAIVKEFVLDRSRTCPKPVDVLEAVKRVQQQTAVARRNCDECGSTGWKIVVVRIKHKRHPGGAPYVDREVTGLHYWRDREKIKAMDHEDGVTMIEEAVQCRCGRPVL